MSAPTWTFELSRAADRPRGHRGHWPGYRGDYGSWSAVAEPEAAAREIVGLECYQSPGTTTVAGDLISVSVDGQVIWENRSRRGEPLQNGQQRSAAAHAALRRRGLL
jgi:hypothetical protein